MVSALGVRHMVKWVGVTFLVCFGYGMRQKDMREAKK
jgi:hypothetical protein